MRKITISGNLGADAVRRYSPDNTSSFLSFNVGVYTGKDKNGNSKTQWYGVTFSGKLADMLEKDLLKGSKVIVVGDLDLGFYQAKDGSIVVTANISFPSVEVIAIAGESRSNSTNNANNNGNHHNNNNNQSVEEDFSQIASDDIPF